VTFRSLRHVGYPGDHHARYSALAELFRARHELPDVIVVSTPGRVGALGLILAAFYSVPLVMVVSTDTTGVTAYYSAVRAVCSGGVKFMLLMSVSRRARAAFFRRPTPMSRERAGRPGRLVARTTAALHADAREVVLLSSKGLPTYGDACPDANATVLPTGIDRLPAAPVPAELAWRAGALRVLYVGRLAPEKNLPLLLQALQIAVEAGVDAHLALVGEGPLRERLVAEADRLGVGDRLTVIGPYPRGQLGGIYASADVFAFPSVVDTQAFVLNEAAHERLALLVSDTANGVVEDGVSAIVVPPEPARYAEALTRLLDRQLRDRLGTAAGQRAERLGEGTQCALLADVIRRAAESRSDDWAQPPVVPAPAWDGNAPAQLAPSRDEAITGATPTR
jgi:glycosyltransferase involved in cell wall biosynthesis